MHTRRASRRVTLIRLLALSACNRASDAIGVSTPTGALKLSD